ncbi:hypothetical protein SAMN05444008_10259 [Cnuella takakiae]|uniref:Uncharacterized protein n=1 Tax=Cnuella takakiae TaxID=1302690 RepID=A0A1M4UV62_9BACT|nr:hypothetical protein [Cnuella takakiae]OLY92772.1 hypothetical protein BUE76_13400 [Cnuella takakiae]SHE60490.1 hypothetical protein SAMN05444008_10259 [Cnuella takakiae]
MKVVYGLLALALGLMACNKDEFQTKPQIKVLSATPDVVPIGQALTVSLEFTDKEGDVDDSVTVIRTRINQRDFTKLPFTIKYKIPLFPDKTRGEMDVNMAWSTALTLQNSPLRIPGTNTNEPDTLRLQFSVKDAKGNRSDTITFDKNVIVIR